MSGDITIPYIQAANYTVGPRANGIDLIVIHDMEAPERLDTAEACANFFARQHQGPGGSSCHYCVDADSIVQCVNDDDIAWHAPGANHNGIGVEHAGYARQSREEWLDEYGLMMMRLSAALVVDLCDRHDIDPIWLDAEALRAGARGITTHRAVTEAFHVFGGHSDPGANFPSDVYLSFILDAVRATVPPPPPPPSHTADYEEVSVRTALHRVADPNIYGTATIRWDPGYGRPPTPVGVVVNGFVPLRNPPGMHTEGTEVVIDISMIQTDVKLADPFDVWVTVS